MTTFHDVADTTKRDLIPAPRPSRFPRRRSATAVLDAPRAAQRRFARMVIAADLLVVTLTVAVTILVGLTGAFAADRALVVCGLLSAALVVAGLWAARTWDSRVLGQGSTEFLRLGRAIVGADVVLAMGGLSLMVNSVRLWVFLIVPLIGLLCLGSRFLLRKWLHQRRSTGEHVLPVLAVGSVQAVADLIRRTRRDPFFGWQITGACTPTGTADGGGDHIAEVPVVGDLDAVSSRVHDVGYHVVAVCQAPGWGAARLHRLAWQLEDTDTELAVDPGLMEIAGPRMHIAPVDGFPLLRLSRPKFTGLARVTKTVTDRALASLILLLLAPILISLALAVWLGDRGPIFFHQERVGANGRTFRLVKFRSMCVDAEDRLAALAATNEGAGPLFKLKVDPRVTRVGHFLRKYSLDELPQLFNVLGGSMSLVGPRPPLAREVKTYADDARRRLLVRPGMTGLWQVSGRSSLSWEESVRLDLRYVENWSLALDLTIMWKTFGAVVRGRGAY
ncbi:sugar transferase [Pseudonocardia endophytica]|uniref:Exopolysaccharide biosynthesis polyprenyl glycosylphosphotransferase n=1 Tax=Pseudonocardia endophytica TaxID=401976 RepID=A0A4R1HU45_PSEEN|nr:sugar transferase [Pseudonocardia endophytica]TCK20952.1 exopolysaccharide biosynthesis polyprenyl glycosylphosphotransferase [Pseudonocardia endophytica]